MLAKIESRPSQITSKISPSRSGAFSADMIAIIEENSKVFAGGSTQLQPLGGKLCLRCGCEGERKCRLKKIAEEMKSGAARSGTLLGDDFLRVERHGDLIYSPAKCVRCALCIVEARRMQPHVQLDFCGRGGATRLIFHPHKAPLKDAAQSLASVCPTAALVYCEHT